MLRSIVTIILGNSLLIRRMLLSGFNIYFKMSTCWTLCTSTQRNSTGWYKCTLYYQTLDINKPLDLLGTLSSSFHLHNQNLFLIQLGGCCSFGSWQCLFNPISSKLSSVGSVKGWPVVTNAGIMRITYVTLSRFFTPYHAKLSLVQGSWCWPDL